MKKLDIRRALTEHNMSQIELAKKSGIIAPNISAIIKGGNPTVAKLMQIAEGIGCDITDLFYPDPAEEAEEKETPAETENDSETLNATLRGDLPEGFILRDVNFVQQVAGSEPAYPVHENGLVSENQQQQMIQTSTFCPHCGKKVRVGVVLLPEEG
jgi:transcriptional regulator with XRE-family HTH domain